MPLVEDVDRVWVEATGGVRDANLDLVVGTSSSDIAARMRYSGGSYYFSIST